MIGHLSASRAAGAAPRHRGLPVLLAAVALVIGVMWMHGASTGHQGAPVVGEHHMAALGPGDDHGHCPDQPDGHDGSACQATITAGAPLHAPTPLVRYAAPAGGDVLIRLITAEQAGDGTGCGPPSRAALSVLRI